MERTLQLNPTPAAEEATDSVLFIGNATVLLRYRGFTILTDPALDAASPT